jgi:hypothetical protein
LFFQSLSVHTNAKDSASKKKTASGCAAAKVFARYDVIETSYHLYSDRIDLHLCDDPGGKGRSCHPRLSEGGAFQVPILKNLFFSSSLMERHNNKLDRLSPQVFSG